MQPLPTLQTRPHPSASFTLVELIAVLAIIVLLVGIVAPAVVSTLKGSQLTQAYPLVIGELNAARQAALTRNRAVEERFYLYDNPPNAATGVTGYACRALQSFVVQEDGTMSPLNKVVTYPSGVIFSARPNSSDANASSLVPRSTAGGTTLGLVLHPASGEPQPAALPGVPAGAYQYLAFQFRPAGSTTLVPPQASADSGSATTGAAANPKRWYFTLHNEHDLLVNGQPPANYVTIQIDPYTGDLRAFRP